MVTKFKPNELTFDEGLERITQALHKADASFGRDIVTSRTPEMKKALEILKVMNAPEGFSKWQLPVI